MSHVHIYLWVEPPKFKVELTMPPKLQVLSIFKFKYLFSGWILWESLARSKFVCCEYVFESSNMGVQRNYVSNLELQNIPPSYYDKC